VPFGRMHHPFHAVQHSTAPSAGIRPAGTLRPHRAMVARRAAGLVTAAAVAVAILPGSSLADPPADEPTLDEVRLEVDALYRELEMAAEVANEAEVRADEVRDALETLRANLGELQADVEDATSEAGTFAAAQYRASGVDPAVEIFLGGDGTSFLSRMSQLDQLADQQARAVTNLSGAQTAMAQQELAIEREVTRLAELEAQAAEAETQAAARHREAEALLDRLTAEEEARLAAEREAAAAAAAAAAARAATSSAAQSAPATQQPPPSSGPVSGRAAIAVQFAMAQIGKPYRYGASGPGSYDCSGLTMAAWAAAGVSLPHSSRAQMGAGRPVSASELQPGDLVFYYSPVHHVGMYIGNGQIVHASNPSKPVGIDPLYSMPYSGAVRVG
jgi:cell wall-associated NlpC family hydrolase